MSEEDKLLLEKIDKIYGELSKKVAFEEKRLKEQREQGAANEQ